MKRFWSGMLVLALSAAMSAQTAGGTATTTAKKKHAAKKASTAEDIQALRQSMEQQQQQIQQLQQQIQQRDATFQQLQRQLQQMQGNAASAQQTAQAAESSSSSQKATVEKLSSDMKDVQTTLTNTAANTQEEQKHVAGIEGTLGRFRWSGDVRVRYETFGSQDNAACPAGSCEFRQRARIRVRMGVEGKLSQDFIGGLFLATGAQTDPTTTNETLTNVFERKNFYLDRGYITYNPVNHRWLSLTGGKWAYSWTRTSVTFDPDLNPEGFNEKGNWNFNQSVLKNFNFQLIELLYNEVSKGPDSYTFGGQAGAKLQFGQHWTMTPSYTLMKWYRPDPILNEAAAVGGPIFAPNGFTNSSFVSGGKNHFASQFLYSDLIINNTFTTPWPRFPIVFIGEYEQNLEASPGQYNASFGVGPCHGLHCASAQDKAYAFELDFGQQKDQGDWQFGYEWRRQEADSVISSFNESDQRAPTNTLQNRFFINYKVRSNVQLSFTDWVGRTLNTALQNAAKTSGIVTGAQEPYLNRAQFDVIYTF